MGIQICEAAIELFGKLKTGMIGGGSFVGFVNAVLDRAPNASLAEVDTSSFGYPIYAEGHLEAAEIMPGNVSTL